MSDITHSRSVHDQSRKQLYDIVAGDGELDAKQRAVVELGTEYLDVSLGFVSRIDTDAERFEVLVSTEEEMLAEGAVYDLSDTYCRRCVESDSPLAVTDAPTAGWESDPAYDEHGLGCYLGTPIRVGGDIVGTLCFADTDPREMDFSSTERAFVELAARLIGQEREIRQYERELDERKERLDRRKEALDATERKYESLITAAPDAIFVARRDTGEIVEVNEAAEELAGLPVGDIVGTSIDSFHPDRRGRYWAEFQRFISDNDETMSRYSDGTQMCLEQSDGTRIPVEISTKTVELDGNEYVQGIVRDISDRREREQELRLKNRAIDEAAIGITIAEATDEAPLVYANEEFENLTGYDWEDVAGENCRFLQGERTDPEGIDEIRNALATKRPVRTELLNYREDGTPFWNDLRITPVEDERGEITHFVGFQQNVTDRKRKEKLITVLNRVLQHNLRNGMSVVMSRAEQLREELGPDPPDPLDNIVDRAHQLTEVGEKAGDISKSISNGSTAHPVDVVPMVENVAERLSDDATVSVETPERQTALATDSLYTALDELGSNAVTHAGPDPTVEFDVERTDGGQVAIHVSDDGPGLPPEEQTVLRRGYETPLEHGSGLGLWFVTWVVTGAGGRVSVDTDDGTTVTLRLQTGDENATRDRQSAIER